MTRPVYSRDTKYDAVKAAMAFVMSGRDGPEARNWATNRFGEAGAPLHINKAAVPADTVGDIDPGSSVGLIDRQLFSVARERSVLGRMRGVRRTGFNVRSTTVSNSTAVWVAEGKPIPVLRPTITATGLDPAKLAALSVWTRESLDASPGIEVVIFADLAKAYADALDIAMFDPTNDGSGDAPASLTYGATALASTGDIDNDLAELFAAFPGSLADAVFVTTPQIGAGLAGDFTGRDIGARGGELAGVPVLTSGALPDGQLTLIDPTTIMAAYDDDLELETSRQGSVELLDDPTNDVTTPTATTLVSLWQTNSVAIRAVGRVAWAAAADTTVSITGLFPSAT